MKDDWLQGKDLALGWDWVTRIRSDRTVTELNTGLAWRDKGHEPDMYTAKALLYSPTFLPPFAVLWC